SKKIGKFTGFYYTASMSAQTVTPILLGLLFNMTGVWRALPIYSAILIVLSCIVFTALVKNIKARKVQNAKGLEAIDGD
ncbi:MAG: MFS transporter, partial [Lachnospiraceae bacterium]|nr:MFS transporter [Lachnospiraceae bacterium]